MKFFLAIIPSIGICCFICGLSNSFRKEINKLLNVKFENIHYTLFGWILYLIFIILKNIFL